MCQASAAINVMWARGILNEMNIEGIVLGHQNVGTGPKNQKMDGKKHCLEKMKNLIIIYADNQGAIKLVNNPIFQKRIKHIAVKYHYTRDLISKGAIKLEYRPTSEMIADGLTKSLGSGQFKRFVEQLGMAKGESIVD